MKRTAKKTKNIYVEYIGWIGVSLLLLAYILLSAGIIIGQSYIYHSMALTGSASIGFSAWYKRDSQPAVLNLIFAFIAIAAITRLTIIS